MVVKYLMTPSPFLQLMDVYVTPSISLWWIMLPWTFVHASLHASESTSWKTLWKVALGSPSRCASRSHWWGRYPPLGVNEHTLLPEPPPAHYHSLMFSSTMIGKKKREKKNTQCFLKLAFEWLVKLCLLISVIYLVYVLPNFFFLFFYLQSIGSRNTAYKYLEYFAKVILREKFIPLSSFVKKQERLKPNQKEVVESNE